MSQKRRETHSPLKAKPLRRAGQSLDEEMVRVLSDDVVVWIVMALIIVYYSALEWVRWWFSVQFHPIIVSLIGLSVLSFAGWKIFRARTTLKALKLGRDGEKLVGEYLDALREKGFRVFHDVVGEGFNVDHVVISPHGIFTVETKTFSKPRGKDATVKVHNRQVTVNGRFPDRDLLDQAKAQANWVNMILRDSTGKVFPVKPVIVFPGWFVEPVPKEDARDVWVLNPKALPTFIENEDKVLPQQDVILATFHLSRYIRTTN